MKITFEEILNGKTWLNQEILNSAPIEVIQQASEDKFYEVKLVINGIEVEPTVFNKILENIERYIKDEAKSLIAEKFADAKDEIETLKDVIRDVTCKICDNYNLNLSDYE